MTTLYSARPRRWAHRLPRPRRSSYDYAGWDSLEADNYAVLNETSFTDGEYALDISAVEESAYYGAWIWGANGSYTQGSCRILRLWLE